MKKSILILCLISVACSDIAYSQNDSDSIFSEQNLMRKKGKNSFPSIYLAISYLSWQGLPSNIEYQPNNNRELSFYKLFNLFRYAEHFNAAFGLSASFLTMHNNVNKWEFDSNGMVKSSQIIPDTLDKRKLSASYLYVPLEIKYKFGKGKIPPFTIGIGGKIGTLLYASQKTKDGDIKIQERVRDGISKINYGTYAYFGYKFVGIIAGYNFSPMFNSDNSPSVTNWTAGLSLLF